MQSFRERGFHVLLAEYRGYGRSEGQASETKVRQDFVRLYDRMQARPDVDPSACVLMGRFARGAAPSCQGLSGSGARSRWC
ncbi:MAG: hypothetical protein IPN77_10790 [Sandaracinaceae bacterium]|nr:hypothetical protein [Sandaracinaceae bacterium]